MSTLEMDVSMSQSVYTFKSKFNHFIQRHVSGQGFDVKRW